jgi:hypothetical protein
MKQRLATIVFTIAGLYGLVTLPPMYFFEDRIAAQFPPAITHPEFFYGFIGVGLAWQLAFFIIASNPGRFRPIMLAAVVEKFSFGIAVIVLFVQRALPVPTVYFACIDLIFGALFTSAFFFTDTRPGGGFPGGSSRGWIS